MTDCIFCKVARGDAPSWKVYENESTYAFLDINPVSRYHTLVIPKKHYQDIFDIEEKDLQALIATVKKVAKYYKEHLGLEDIQIISNSGAAAQQTVFHLHFHIVPRHHG
ncbi:MAG: HIT family protein, partial [Bacteroidota bacterium]